MGSLELNPAETLRAAAKALRERAAAEAILRDGDPYYERQFLPNGEWVSEASAWDIMMHPGVGLDLADLLDMLAGDHEQADVDGDTWDHGVMPLARAILGESADDVLDLALDGTAAGEQCPPGQEEAWSREFGACPECKATWPNLHVYTRNPQAVLCVKCGWAA